MHHHANYATVFIDSHLRLEDEALNLDWTDDAGDETETFEFDVPTDDPRESYLGIQAFDVGEYGHEIQIDDDPLSRFDIPPDDGWQYWVGTAMGVNLVEGTSTIRIIHGDGGNNAFAVETAMVH